MHPARGRARDKRVPVFLNVYDLLEHNKYGYTVGIGAFHSGVEIYGTGIAPHRPFPRDALAEPLARV